MNCYFYSRKKRSAKKYIKVFLCLVLMAIQLAAYGVTENVEASQTTSRKTVVANYGDGTLYIVDLVSGDRELLSGNGKGTGPAILGPVGMTLTKSGSILAGEWTNDARIFRIDPTTGDRVVLSGGSPDVVGTGPNMGRIGGLVEQENGDIIACTEETGIFKIDPTTGNRTVLASNSVGSGAAFTEPFFCIGETDGSIIYTSRSTTEGVFKLNPTTKERTAISSNAVGTGTSLVSPSGIAKAPDGTYIVLEEQVQDVYAFQVEPTTGNRTTISGQNKGTGNSIGIRYGLTVAENGNIYVADFDDKITLIESASGNRTVVSSATVGSGPALNSPLGMLPSSVSSIGNAPPVASNVTITGNTKVGSTLTGSYNYSDHEGDQEGATTFTWYRADDNNGANKTAITGATTNTYVIQNEDKGKYISFEVTPFATAGATQGQPVVSSYVGPIPVATTNADLRSVTLNIPFTWNQTTSDSIQVAYDVSTVDVTATPADSKATVKIGNSTTVSDTIALNVGINTIPIEVTAEDGTTTKTYTLTITRLTQLIANQKPTAANVSIAGATTVGNQLTGSYAYQDLESDAEGASTFKWYRSDDASGTNANAILGATAKTYTLLNEDQGKYIGFEVTPIATTGDTIGIAVKSPFVGPIQGISSSSSGGSSAPSSQTEQIKVNVETGNIRQGQAITEVTITRTTNANGAKLDKVIFEAKQAKETVQKAKELGQTMARIVIPDVKDEVAQVDVRLPLDAIKELASGKLNLEIYTENVGLNIPATSLQGIKQEVYFNIIPIKEEQKQKGIENRAKFEVVVQEVSGGEKVSVIGRPMTIETNLQSQPVDLVLPLRNVNLPTDEAERQAFLEKLAIFIEHSDGEKELKIPEVVEYKNGQIGLKFSVTKFSIFTILSIDGLAEKQKKEEIIIPTESKSYIIGFPDGTFKPEHTISRAEMAAILSRVEASKKTTSTATVFPDVPSSHWAKDVIEEANASGLMKGLSNGTFGPNQAITRAEVAAIISRWLDLNGDSQLVFQDSQTHWAAKDIALVNEAGFVKGMPDGTFQPNKALTRAEAVTIFNRVLKRPLTESSKQTFSDVPVTHWAFKDIEVASKNSK
ncbi:MAG TPA: hypothetical protein GX497_02085 [Bacillus bacterium]|nr:hypothetical protein [Bacillus sp. (in: firmicutes)]